MHAIVEILGNQFYAKEGQVISIPKLGSAPNKKLKFDKVIFFCNKDDGDAIVGKPYIENASVECVLLGHFKGPKIEIFKKKSRKNFQKHQGHRQQFSKVLINKINIGNK